MGLNIFGVIFVINSMIAFFQGSADLKNLLVAFKKGEERKKKKCVEVMEVEICVIHLKHSSRVITFKNIY